ncbi:MAG: glycosyltransferase family 9 protein [Nitrospirae bacterium]|nr:glycosyltransferase family 9 protein [Nitrospirota bacterium]
MARTILIVHPGALGDVLLALPSIRAVQAGFPTHALGLVAGTEVGSLLHACAEIDTVFPLETGALAELLAGPESVEPVLRGWLRRCDLAVCWMKDSDGKLHAALRELGAGRVIVRSPVSSDCEAVHQVDRFLETVSDVVPVRAFERGLRLPHSILAGGKSRLAGLGVFRNQSLVAIHPGSGSRHKCCEPALFAALAEWCRANDLLPLLLGGPADDEMIARVSELCKPQPLILQRLDLHSIAGGLAWADLFVGHDSGLTHLAAALLRPTVALFGPTESRRWAPRGPHVTILTGDPCRCQGQGWRAVQACTEKPCLQVPIERLTGACRRSLQPQAV